MKNRFEVLDGWRGISISLVLAGHLLPLGVKSWRLNGAIAATGMALFFILSGFLITNILLKNQNIKSFLIKRMLRILPLAWLILLIIFLFEGGSSHQWFSNFLFYANWPPMGLKEITSHFWSLCVEIQFYIGIAFLVFFFKNKAFLCIPLLCLSVTGYRIYCGVEMAINTYFRVDEILAGCILAMIFHSNNLKLKQLVKRINPLLLLALLIFSAHPLSGILNYLRPYIAMCLIGSTLFVTTETKFNSFLKNPILLYLANISYALYIFHGVFVDTWLGSGDKIVKYIKRPLLFIASLICAHVSTQYYEKYWINLGKKLTSCQPILNGRK